MENDLLSRPKAVDKLWPTTIQRCIFALIEMGKSSHLSALQTFFNYFMFYKYQKYIMWGLMSLV